MLAVGDVDVLLRHGFIFPLYSSSIRWSLGLTHIEHYQGVVGLGEVFHYVVSVVVLLKADLDCQNCHHLLCQTEAQ